MRVGPYTLQTRLGQGSTGSVWAATHAETGREAAIKLLAAAHVEAPSVRRLFVSEAHTLARLSHPHIIHAHDFGTVAAAEATAGLRAGQPWLALERMSGGTLQALRGRQPWRVLAPLLARLLSALGHAHAHGVLHLDLKPENVLLDDAPESLRLSDFGLAIQQLPHNRTLVTPELAAGTPVYMAPEQIERRWRALGPWTDLYAMGILTWTLAAGRVPFRGGEAAILAAHREAPLPPLPPHAAWAEGLDAWLARACAKAPRDRFTSAAEALAALPGRPSLPDASASPRWSGLSLAAQRRSLLVGRDREQARLAALLAGVQADGRARVAVLRGRSGTGKSRLAHAAATAAAEAHGARIVSAIHGAIPGPHDGLPAALGRHLRSSGLAGEALDAQLTEVLGPAADTAVSRERRALLSDEERLEPRARHAALARMLASLGGPVVLVADDVQWGLDAIAGARYLLGRPVPVLVLLCAQEEALSAQRAARTALHALQASDGCETIALSPLPRAQRGALVAGVLPLAPDLADAVAERCEGYPIYAVQLVRSWAARGLLRPGPDGFTRVDGAEIRLPPDLAAVWQETVAQALAGRPADDGTALEIAAALGARVSRSAWAATCGARGCRPSDDLVDHLVQRNLLRPRPGGFSFVHGMLREALAQRALGAGRLRAHHAAAAVWLLAEGEDEQAAGHFLAAGQEARALAPLLAAVERRRRQGDVDQCRALLDRHEEALVSLGLPASDLRWAEGLLLRTKLEGALGDTDLEAEAAEALIARAAAQGWRVVRCQGQLALCSARRRQGRYHVALSVAAAVLAEARALQHPSLIAQACWEQGLSLKNRGRAEEATALLQESVAAARQAGEPIMLAGALLSLGYALLKGGDAATAAAPIHEAEALYVAEGVRIGAANCANARGELRRAAGDLVGAAMAYREAVEGHAGTVQLHVSRLNLCICLQQCDEPAAALEIAETSLPELRRIGWENLIGAAHALALPCAAALGDWDAWDRHAAAAEDSLCASGFVDRDIEQAAARAAALAAEAGHEARAAHARGIAQLQRLELG